MLYFLRQLTSSPFYLFPLVVTSVILNALKNREQYSKPITFDTLLIKPWIETSCFFLISADSCTSSPIKHGQWRRSQSPFIIYFAARPTVLFFIRLLQSHWAEEWMSITHSFTWHIRDKSQMLVVVCQFSVQRANHFPLTIPLQVQYLPLCQSALLFFTLFPNCSLTFLSLAPLLSSPCSLCGWSDFPLFHS